MSREITLAYAAGLVDGEGHFGIGRVQRAPSYTYVTRFVVGMTHKPTLEWFKAQFNGTINSRPAQARTEILYTWSLSGRPQLLTLLPELLTYLKTKKVHATLLLEFLQSFPSYGSAYLNSGPRGETMNKYFELMQALNGVGPGSSKVKEELSNVLAMR